MALNDLSNYYRGVSSSGNSIPQNTRTYNIANPGGDNTNKGYNSYYVVYTEEDGSKTVEIPLWTRPKTMILNSGFTGNNPYDEFQRMARLKITATFKLSSGGTATLKKEVPVYQVRRISNPKAVWRRFDDNNSFHVQLARRPVPSKILPVQGFTKFASEGPWIAYVEAGNEGFVTLSGGNEIGTETITDYDGNNEKTVHAVKGYNGSFIDFNIDFNGSTESTESRYAIVTVKYHDLKCTHKIFVRQGYDNAEALFDRGAKWSSYSVYSCKSNITAPNDVQKGGIEATLTNNPLALGTLYKRGNTRDGIYVSNNYNYNGQSGYGPLEPLYNGNTQALLRVTPNNGNNGSIRWNDIDAVLMRGKYPTHKNYIDRTNWEWSDFNATVRDERRKYRVPTYDDFQKLAENCDFGFGVMYGSGATETKMDLDGAFGFTDPDNNTETSVKGVKGCVVYNSINGKQTFFSFGTVGMARRTRFNVKYLTDLGYLRYADVYDVLSASTNSSNAYRPIVHNLPYVSGALYWTRKINMEGHIDVVGGSPRQGPCAAWDFNYLGFDFAPYTANCLFNYTNKWYRDGYGTGEASDALPIKLIRID